MMDTDLRTVEMVEGGAVRTVTYRQAVSLVSRGLAVWGTTDTAALDQEEGAAQPQSQPQDDLQEPEDEPEAEPVPKAQRKRSTKKSTLSTPAGDGQEGAEAENKPPTSE